MNLYSWNVNGIRACVKKGTFEQFLTSHDPDILFLQETKARPEDLPDAILNPTGYHTVWHSAEKKGYSGVALLTKEKPLSVIEGLGYDEFDSEGRAIIAKYPNFSVIGCYFPNGGRGPERIEYKLRFYKTLFDMADEMRAAGESVIICGDYNTAHEAIDLARPKENEGVSGFMRIERDWMDEIVRRGYVDTFRHQHPDETDHYTWWTYRSAARKRNVGWRIDYVFVDQDFLPKVSSAVIEKDVLGSDHCPVGIHITT